jgi:thiamine-phosphate pyrophosphorylase
MPENVLAAALDGAEVACVLLRIADGGANAGHARALCAVAQEAGAAFLVADDTSLAAAIAADGVHLDDPAGYGDARRELGPDAIVGVGCGRSRHAAMEAGDAGADYVAFTIAGPDDLETIADWSAMTVVPCVAMGDVGLDNAAAVVEAGADFLAIDASWRDAAEAQAALAGYTRILNETRRRKY